LAVASLQLRPQWFDPTCPRSFFSVGRKNFPPGNPGGLLHLLKVPFWWASAKKTFPSGTVFAANAWQLSLFLGIKANISGSFFICFRLYLYNGGVFSLAPPLTSFPSSPHQVPKSLEPFFPPPVMIFLCHANPFLGASSPTPFFLIPVEFFFLFFSFTSASFGFHLLVLFDTKLPPLQLLGLRSLHFVVYLCVLCPPIRWKAPLIPCYKLQFFLEPCGTGCFYSQSSSQACLFCFFLPSMDLGLILQQGPLLWAFFRVTLPVIIRLGGLGQVSPGWSPFFLPVFLSLPISVFWCAFLFPPPAQCGAVASGFGHFREPRVLSFFFFLFLGLVSFLFSVYPPRPF